MHDMTIPAVPRRIGVVALTVLTIAAIGFSAPPAAQAGAIQTGCDSLGRCYEK
jgi:hypothetical protein